MEHHVRRQHPIRHVVATAWDLGGLRDAHAAFIDRWAGVQAPDDPQAAFATRVSLVHDWRAFLHLDPGLPASLLPDDWLGDDAAACFRRVYEAVERPAWRFYDALVLGAPGGLLNARDAGEVASPFATDLHALQTRTTA